MTVPSKKKLISYNSALEIIHQISGHFTQFKSETSSILEAKNRILSNDVYSEINVPSFNNSAMDGFAVQTQQIQKLIDNNQQIKLQVTGSIQAGDSSETNATHDTPIAWEIMTGAPVPEAFDAVIQIENVQIESTHNGKYIIIDEEVKAGRNIRKSGTDYTIGQLVVAKHSIIQSQHIMALSTVGKENIDIIPRIPVAVISTGNELTKTSKNNLTPGKIFNSNQPFLMSYCENLNCKAEFIGKCDDNIDAFNQLIDEALEKKVKIIFSTGAVSMGKYDFIPQALIQRGAKIHFHKAKIRPGKPILFAELPCGTIYFGLPGNPIAAASGMRFFVSPFIRKALKLADEKPIQAKLLNDINKKHGFRTFAKAFASLDHRGQLNVEMLMDQGSYQSRSFAQSNCWLILPEERENLTAGEIVSIAPMIPNQLIL
jgi:molybdopterin molybdotransferase